MSNVFVEIDALVAELTQLMPPPKTLQGVTVPIDATRSWFIEDVGGGFLALRARYVCNVTGNVVNAEPTNEIVGRPTSLLTALRFTVDLARASTARFDWRRVTP